MAKAEALSGRYTCAEGISPVTKVALSSLTPRKLGNKPGLDTPLCPVVNHDAIIQLAFARELLAPVRNSKDLAVP